VLLSLALLCQTDVWSFSMMLWEALDKCRRMPYYNYSVRQLEEAEHLRSGARPAIPSLWEQECPGIEQLLRDCWQHHPKDRPNFLQIMGRLLKIIDAMPDTAAPSPAPAVTAAVASAIAAAAKAWQPSAPAATAAAPFTACPTATVITAAAAAAESQALATRTANLQVLQQLAGASQLPALNAQQSSRVQQASQRKEQHHLKAPAATASATAFLHLAPAPAATAAGAAAAALQALVVQLRDSTRTAAAAGHQGALYALEQVAEQQQQGSGALLQVGVTCCLCS
jgi:hypothetical protein